MGDEREPPKPPPPDPATGYFGERIRGISLAAGKLIGLTSLGGAGGFGGGLVALALDPTGQSTIEAVRIGVWLGGLSGLFKVLSDNPVRWVLDYRRDDDRRARVEAERDHRACRAELESIGLRMSAAESEIRLMKSDHETAMTAAWARVQQAVTTALEAANELAKKDPSHDRRPAGHPDP